MNHILFVLRCVRGKKATTRTLQSYSWTLQLIRFTWFNGEHVMKPELPKTLECLKDVFYVYDPKYQVWLYVTKTPNSIAILCNSIGKKYILVWNNIKDNFPFCFASVMICVSCLSEANLELKTVQNVWIMCKSFQTLTNTFNTM